MWSLLNTPVRPGALIATEASATRSGVRDCRPVEPIRLLIVADSLSIGGAERHVCGLALALTGQGYDVTVACSVGGPLSAPLEEAGIAVRPLLDRLVKRRFSPRFTWKLVRLIRDGRFDLVHAHMYASAVASALASLDSGAPFVLTEHTEGSWRTPFSRWCNRGAYRRAERVIAVSAAIRRRLVEQDRVPPERVATILNSLPPALNMEYRARPPHPKQVKDAPVVGVIARLVPEKGVRHFLDAAARLSRAVPGARFLVLGDGPLREHLRVHRDRLGLGDSVQFLGFREDAPALVGTFDILILPSLSNEGSPLVTLEAMAAGVPVVASTVGGIPEQIWHDREGLLVPPGDAAALSEAVVSLLRDPARARRLGEAGRRRVSSEFSYATMLRQTERVYLEALRQPVPASLLRGDTDGFRPRSERVHRSA